MPDTSRWRGCVEASGVFVGLQGRRCLSPRERRFVCSRRFVIVPKFFVYSYLQEFDHGNRDGVRDEAAPVKRLKGCTTAIKFHLAGRSRLLKDAPHPDGHCSRLTVRRKIGVSY
jgi:hypothetical protein